MALLCCFCPGCAQGGRPKTQEEEDLPPSYEESLLHSAGERWLSVHLYHGQARTPSDPFVAFRLPRL